VTDLADALIAAQRALAVVDEMRPDALPVGFWLRVSPQASGCWEWVGRRDRKGYGEWGRGGSAHRFVYAAMIGPIPAGLHVHHACHNRGCVNPAHLEAVTAAVNNQRRDEAFGHPNARKTHCKRGHAFTTSNTHRYRGKRVCRACRRRVATA
jgi:hypothetical protein